MDDFIFPEDIDEENIDVVDMDVDGSGVTDSRGGDRELEPKSDSVLSVDRCAQAMTDTLQKYEKVKKRIAEVDQLAMQARTFLENSVLPSPPFPLSTNHPSISVDWVEDTDYQSFCFLRNKV